MIRAPEKIYRGKGRKEVCGAEGDGILGKMVREDWYRLDFMPPPPHSYAEVLALSSPECDYMWRLGL